ncbi:MAG: hypothetical protein KAR44_09070 [Candidatus Aegiribacteria sp.]|nr:hypothetical protein [Candidatus Aegiribacteria sp.]
MKNERIDKKRKMVRFTLNDGTEITGEIHLWLYSSNRMGPQRIDELLNDESSFIPVKTPDGYILLNSTNISLAQTEMEKNIHDPIMIGEKYRVHITTSLPECLEVDLFISLPEGFQRVKDYLDQKIQFFTFFTPEHILCINRDSILFIRD